MITADGSIEIEAEGFLISDGCLGFVRGEDTFHAFGPGGWLEVVEVEDLPLPM